MIYVGHFSFESPEPEFKAENRERGDLARLGEDMAGDRMRTLLTELHGYAGVTQLVAERFV